MKTKTTFCATLAAVLMLGMMSSCDRPDSEGPAINDLYGVFEILDSLQLTEASPDFSIGESVGFSCKFSKPVNWILSIEGLETAASSSLKGFRVNCCLNKTFGTATVMTFLFSPLSPVEWF